MFNNCVCTLGWLSCKDKADLQPILSFCLGFKSLLGQTLSPFQSNNLRPVVHPHPIAHLHTKKATEPEHMDTLCIVPNNPGLSTDFGSNST